MTDYETGILVGLMLGCLALSAASAIFVWPIFYKEKKEMEQRDVMIDEQCRKINADIDRRHWQAAIREAKNEQTRKQKS